MLLGLLPRSGAAAGLPRRDELRQTFFAGAFFDPKASPSSHLIRYLVAPNAGATTGPCHSLVPPAEKKARETWHGNELTARACEILGAGSPLLGVAHLTLTGAQEGNPVALYVSRAQHESVRINFPGHTAYHTVVSIAVALDAFTDHAAFRSTRRFESLYSRLEVVEQPIMTDAPLDDAALVDQYRRTFHDAVVEVASRAAEDLSATPARSSAVFQLDHFALPKALPSGLDQLVEAAIDADGRTGEGRLRQREVERLRAEFQHTVHQFVVAEIHRRGLSDIAVLSPPSPWTDAYVLRLLLDRIGGYDDSDVLSKIDVTAMNGYTITAAMVRAGTVTKSESRGVASRVFTAEIAARIFRPHDGAAPEMMPVSTRDSAAKTATGFGGEGYVDVAEIERPATRELALSAMRRASQDLAPKLVDLMVKTAHEVNR